VTFDQFVAHAAPSWNRP